MTAKSVSVNPAQTPELTSYLRTGDLSRLGETEQNKVLLAMCERYSLDPVFRPFQLLQFQGKTIWYLLKSGTDQIAKNHNLSRRIISEDVDWERCLIRVTAEATDGQRIEQANAALFFGRFERGQVKPVAAQGEELQNAFMKVQSKAFRRVTMAWAGVPDNDLIDSEPATVEVKNQVELKQLSSGDTIDSNSGEFVEPKKKKTRSEIENEKLGKAGEEKRPVPISETLEAVDVLAKKEAPAVAKKTEMVGGGLAFPYDPEQKTHKAVLVDCLKNLGVQYRKPDDSIDQDSMELTKKVSLAIKGKAMLSENNGSLSATQQMKSLVEKELKSLSSATAKPEDIEF